MKDGRRMDPRLRRERGKGNEDEDEWGAPDGENPMGIVWAIPVGLFSLGKTLARSVFSFSFFSFFYLPVRKVRLDAHRRGRRDDETEGRNLREERRNGHF